MWVIEKRQNPILQEPRSFKCKRFITTSAFTISTLYQNTWHIKHRFRSLPIRLWFPKMADASQTQKRKSTCTDKTLNQRTQNSRSKYLAVTKIEINLKILLVLQENKRRLHTKKKKINKFLYIYIFIYFLSRFLITNIYKQVGKRHGRQL